MTIQDRARRNPKGFWLGWLLGGLPLAFLFTNRRRGQRRPQQNPFGDQ